MSARANARSPAQTRDRQQRASDPAGSAWVSANAGSGKTHVLAQRVLRLLLAGRAAVADSLPHLHQGGGGQHVGAGVQGRSAEWTPLDDDELERRDRRAGAPAPADAELELRAQAVRAHHRDAGRAEDPDHPRVLRAAAASVSVRGQCRRRLSRRRGARGRRSAAERARRRRSRARVATPISPRRSRRRARSPAPDGFDALLSATLQTARANSPRSAAPTPMRRACARGSGSRPARASPRSARRCSKAAAGRSAGAIGRARSTPAPRPTRSAPTS